MKPELPAKYYLHHFHEFLGYFSAASSTLLRDKDIAFIGQFQALSEDQQCVVVRTISRKAKVLELSKLKYDEIHDIKAQFACLKAQGWFTSIGEMDARDVAQALTKPKLVALVKSVQPDAKGLASLAKAELAERFVQLAPDWQWWTHGTFDDYFTRTFDDVVDYLKFLYFGHVKGQLNQFSMRDLGIMQTRESAQTQQARFDTLDDAQAGYFYAQSRTQLQNLSTQALLALSPTHLPTARSYLSQRLKDKYIMAVGNVIRQQDVASALGWFAVGEGDTAQERWVRDAYQLGLKDEVKAKLETIISDPASDRLLYFAEDFYARKFHQKRTSALTDMLRSATQELDIDVNYKQDVEQGVIDYYLNEGIDAVKTENRLWRSLFGLTFWPLLFEDIGVATQFDRTPVVLKENRFYHKYHDAIDKVLADILTGKDLYIHITKMVGRHYGTTNGIFLWRTDLLGLVQRFLQATDIDTVKSVLLGMCQDYQGFKDGFPDLMLIDNGTVRFEEIKSDGDSIRRNQMITMKRLQEAGFDVGICRVNWCRNPQQSYVVVDVETTGGKADNHRITEIGMVKMVAGEVVDSYQTLVNPQRHIPRFITQLTGISNEMVATAPTFAEVLDEVEKFCLGSVFVAHNVNFDYGVIKQEFARQQRGFKRPKMCTVQEMRKYQPGLKSYSLAALTAHFAIEMEQHHRALSDAKAAAQLLAITLN